jgi:hypothetical protein
VEGWGKTWLVGVDHGRSEGGDLQARRGGDFGIPDVELAPAVRLRLRDVERLVLRADVPDIQSPEMSGFERTMYGSSTISLNALRT